jgi:endonuclease/exonuclease/phosphatase family metal-dependent hydrolase
MLEAAIPDVICLTEAFAGNLPDYGEIIEAEADYGYPIRQGRRKVILWTKHQWADADQSGHPDMPGGRFAAATLLSPFGPVRVIGVCIPWAAAHVTSGRRDRVRWEDHGAYLQALGQYLAAIPSMPTVIMGDFNQTIPRRRQPSDVYRSLEERVLQAGFTATTGGLEMADGSLLIDHILVSSELTGSLRELLPAVTSDQRLSDHTGVVAWVGRRQAEST